MGYQCKLSIEGFNDRGLSIGTQPQLSPLVFKTLPECSQFGNLIFEPPQSVKGWSIVPTRTRVNAFMSNGVVRTI